MVAMNTKVWVSSISMIPTDRMALSLSGGQTIVPRLMQNGMTKKVETS